MPVNVGLLFYLNDEYVDGATSVCHCRTSTYCIHINFIFMTSFMYCFVHITSSWKINTEPQVCLESKVWLVSTEILCIRLAVTIIFEQDICTCVNYYF